MKVSDIYVFQMYRCSCVIEVNLYAVIRNAYGPKQTTRSNTRIEIVDLIGKITRDNLPLIEIQSNEAESSVVLFPIHPNVDPLHEAHVSVEGKGSRHTSLRVCSSTRPVDNSGSKCAMKIKD